MFSRSIIRRGLSTAAAAAPKIESPRIVLAESFAKLHAVRAAKDSASVAAAAKNSIKIDAKALPESLTGLEEYVAAGAFKQGSKFIPNPNRWWDNGIAFMIKSTWNQPFSGMIVYSAIFTLVALGYPLSQLDMNSPAAKKSDYLIQKNNKKLWDEIVLERAKHPLI